MVSNAVEVRNITEEEVPAYITAMEAGFHHVTRDGIVDWLRRHIEVDKTHAAFDGSAVVGTSRWFETDLTVPGGTLPAAAVTEVTVTATHRRRGLLTQMMAAERDDFVSRGIAVAILIAAEAPIYGRFGYGMATEDATLTISVPMTQFTVAAPSGTVRRTTPAELVAEGPAVFDRFRLSSPGEIERKPLWWDYLINRPPNEEKKPGEEFHVLRRDADGVVDGFASYRVRGEWEDRIPNGTLEIDDLIATSDDAYVALWQHCTSVDWVRRVKAPGRPPVEPLPFLLTDRRAATQKVRGDFVWLRILDPAAALAARTYEVDDRLVLKVVDKFGGPARGTFVVDGGPKGASSEESRAKPDLTVEVADLGSAYLGGTPLWPAAFAGRVKEHRSGAVAAFDRMFGTTVAPWCTTGF